MGPVDGFIKVPMDSADPTGKSVDTSVVTTSIGLVHRERDNIADPTDGNAIAAVRSRSPNDEDYAVFMREVLGPDFLQTQQAILYELRCIKRGIVLQNNGETFVEDDLTPDPSEEIGGIQ